MNAAVAWSATTAGALGVFKGGSGFPTRFQGRRTGQYPFYKVSDMNLVGNDLFMTVANNYVSEAVRTSLGATAFPANTIVFAKVGAAVFLERKRVLTVPSCVDNNMAAFVIDQRVADPRFIHYALTNFKLGSLVAVGALPSLNGTQLRSIPLLLPPTVDEQQGIVRVLSDADDLIGSLERLLAKKRDIKQGMMQELLTGRTRLPGYTKPWQAVTWADVTERCASGATPLRSRSDFYGGSIPWVTSTELKYGRVTRIPQTITRAGLEAANLTVWPDGTFLMAITGLEAAGTRGSCGLLGVAAATNQSCMAVIPNETLDTQFLYYFYLLRGEELALRYCQGTKQQSYTAGIVKTLPIYLPTDIREQRAIIQMLADVDADIDALRVRLSTARSIKMGMMQELLTGHTRLLVEEDAV